MMFLALVAVISCVAWTVTQEFIFEDFRNVCKRNHNHAGRKCERTYGLECALWKIRYKFWYLPTCHYCFSHYVTALLLLVTHYQLIYSGFLGYVVAFFSLVWVANVVMTLYAILRQNLKLLTARAAIVDYKAKPYKG